MFEKTLMAWTTLRPCVYPPTSITSSLRCLRIPSEPPLSTSEKNALTTHQSWWVRCQTLLYVEVPLHGLFMDVQQVRVLFFHRWPSSRAVRMLPYVSAIVVVEFPVRTCTARSTTCTRRLRILKNLAQTMTMITGGWLSWGSKGCPWQAMGTDCLCPSCTPGEHEYEGQRPYEDKGAHARPARPRHFPESGSWCCQLA